MREADKGEQEGRFHNRQTRWQSVASSVHCDDHLFWGCSSGNHTADPKCRVKEVL